MDFFMAGGKEAKMRADAVIKRRNSANAQITDLDLEMEDLRVSLQLDSKDYSADDIKAFREAVERCQNVINMIYNDVRYMADKPVPERINEQQAFEFMQPALRIEGRIPELKQYFEKARNLRNDLTKPRDEAAGNIADVERKRLQAEIDMASLAPVLEQMKAGYADTYPQMNAAFMTANNEVKAATQMVVSARMALDRKSWREANDLARRAATIFDSAASKIRMVRSSQADFTIASTEADDALADAMSRLKVARQRLTEQVGMPVEDVNRYLNPSVQKLGEARRAYSTNPPQHMTALRLAKESLSLLEQGLILANEEVYKVSAVRAEAHEALRQLNDVVGNLRITLNSMRTVPVRANDCYRQSRDIRDRLMAQEFMLTGMSMPQARDFLNDAQKALELAQEGLKLVGGG